ncbi:MAG: hypothetical protein IAG10_24200 [Planctomycetaceae bacterium]|nr:hypothetical protein [Planctomycetaceae bacterium]
MGRYHVVGADRQTGEDIEIDDEAADENAAREKASRRGILVSGCSMARSSAVISNTLAATRPPPLPELSTALPSPVGRENRQANATEPRPLLTTAAVLSFVWAGLMTLVAMVQIAQGVAILALWNLAVATLYVLIGLGLLKRHPKAYNWALWTNAINSVMAAVQLATEGTPLLAVFLILQVIVAVLIVLDRRASGSGTLESPVLMDLPTTASPSSVSPPAANIATAHATSAIRQWWMRTTGPGSGPKGMAIRLATIAGGTFVAFAVIVGGAFLMAELTSGNHSDGINSSDTGRTGNPLLDEDQAPVPPVSVSGPFADKVSYSNWRWQKSALVGDMQFIGDSTLGFGGSRYRVLKDGVVEDSGRVSNPEGRRGDTLQVRILYPHLDREGLSVEIITEFGGPAGPPGFR